ncbi:MAG: twin transmembrane helix small protein [Xanthomonadales bacterium]|jgi:succinate dehydrogenase/fumarate reductase cytochrome b subunit|nr:twin transmembrane helix small protein [Xanthomonadales bacterium]
MWYKLIIFLFLAAILYSLGSGFYFMMKDKGESDRLVRSLTWRIGLSLALFLMLFAAFKLGYIQPNGYSPVRY